ncbi:MAG: hypothetical protein PHR28_08960 [candidate division Zixibacteria bacterium]|nr:hypothetical protein [candidate division Zixibacteria bacterium]
MRFGTLTALAASLLVIMALAIGCSDDDATAPSITYGDNDDPVFVPVQAQIDEVLSSIVGDFAGGMGSLYTVIGDTVSVRAELMPPWMVPNPDEEPVDTLIAGYANDWHYVYASYLGNAYRSTYRDSLQYRIDGTPVEHPTTGVDYVHTIKSWDITGLNQNVSHLDLNGRSDYVLADLDQTVASIEGSAHHMTEATYVATDTSFIGNFSFDITVDGVEVTKAPTGWLNACPTSGSIALVLSHVYTWTSANASGNGSGNWTITAVFVNGAATVTAANGTDTWQYTCDVCEPVQ